jgi:TonB family protein
MLSDKIFKNALIFSILLHMLIFVRLPRLEKSDKIKMPEDTEFIVLPDQRVPIDSTLIAEKQTVNPSSRQNSIQGSDENEKSVKRDQQSKPFPDRQAYDSIKVSLSDKPELGIDDDHLDENMLISHQSKDLSSDPVYLDYYNSVRSQIYKSAQANRPYYFMEGGVSLVFTLDKTGRLLSVGVAQEKSTKNPMLQKHALSSIERSAPFSPFHESMKEHELTLRITISFEK